MTQIVVVDQSHRAGQNVAQRWHLQRMHMRHGDEKSEWLIHNVQLEQRSSSNDLQSKHTTSGYYVGIFNRWTGKL